MRQSSTSSEPTGARWAASSKARRCSSDGDNLVIFASKAGAPTHPDWYHNLVANPEVTVEVGAGTVPVRARVADGDERERLWSRQIEVMPGFAEYQSKTDRTIPVVVLEQRSS
jgi:deazaflavin-dependent oxidoreductase (nitroreductase family)